MMQEEIDKLNEKIRELQCNVNELQEKLDNQEEIVNTFPKDGEKYCYFTSNLTLLDEIYEDWDFTDKIHKEVGNCFRTKEEAEKAVEKLKALKRLRDKGFKFEGWEYDPNDMGFINIRANFLGKKWRDEAGNDLNLLFKEEE